MCKYLFLFIICGIAFTFLLCSMEAKPWPDHGDEDSNGEHEYDDDDDTEDEDDDDDVDDEDQDDLNDDFDHHSANEETVPVHPQAEHIVSITTMPPPTTAPVLRQNPALKSDYERCKNDPACSYNYCAAEAKQADCEQDYLNCNAFVLGDKSSIKRQSCQNGNKYSIVMRTCVSESTCEQSRQD